MVRDLVDFISNSIEYYLPVYIPITLTLLSIGTGMLTKRISLDLRSLLKIHSDLILALFSFIVWAVVAYHQTGKINLNQDYSISLVRVLLLLLADIIFMIAGQIVLSVATKTDRIEKRANAIMLIAAVILVILPIPLSLRNPEPTKVEVTQQKIQFRVVIPYSDDSISRQLGAARWSGRVLCEITSVQAINRENGINEALELFKMKGRDVALFQEPNWPKKVRILNESIITEKFLGSGISK